jgi:hypothetical protein
VRAERRRRRLVPREVHPSQGGVVEQRLDEPVRAVVPELVAGETCGRSALAALCLQSAAPEAPRRGLPPRAKAPELRGAGLGREAARHGDEAPVPEAVVPELHALQRAAAPPAPPRQCNKQKAGGASE